MKIACYCRVSTKKIEQLESLENQIGYFNNLMEKNKSYDLFEIYYDEGISAKQMKNRKDFLRMMSDAKKGLFDTIMVKDITRFSRNTVDFLVSIRDLKQMGINVIFVSYGQETLKEETELNLTMQIAFAQEESARLSKKVKWGKNINARKGRVPNFVFGYDKVDLFTLKPNPEESEIVKKMFDLYVNEGIGTPSIAKWLTKNKIKTKKNRQSGWTQKVVLNILTNSIYIGKVINKKSEIVDFIEGTRKQLEINPDYIVDKPEFRIVSDDIFYKTKEIITQRREKLGNFHNRQSNKHPFSNLIKCSCCGYSFRRIERMYTKLYSWWACSCRNTYGVDACINQTRIEECDLENELKQFLSYFVINKKHAIKSIVNMVLQSIPKNEISKENIEKTLEELKRNKEKYIDMFKNDLLTMEELKTYLAPINDKVGNMDIQLINYNNKFRVNEKDVYKYVEKYIDNIKNILGKEVLNNHDLKEIIDRIEISPDGQKDIYMKLDSTGKLVTQLPMNILEIKPTQIDTTVHKDVTFGVGYIAI